MPSHPNSPKPWKLGTEGQAINPLGHSVSGLIRDNVQPSPVSSPLSHGLLVRKAVVSWILTVSHHSALIYRRKGQAGSRLCR